MNSKKYQIFVSSTYKDLAEVRRGVIECIQRMLHFAVGMEQFSSDDDEQWQIIQETIQQTDYYICIIGHRYGTISKDGRSFTEKEWDYSRELGIPIMTFVRHRDSATKPHERESEPDTIKKLDAFITKATADKMVDFWADTNDLNTKVMAAVYKAFSRKPRPGWMRTQSERVAEELAVLMDENRRLRNQVEKLTSQITHSRPILKVTINDSETIVLAYKSDDQLTLTESPSIEPLVWEDVPEELKPHTSKKDIDDYNRQLPTAEELAGKVHKFRTAERIQQTIVDLVATVVNRGTAKARQVYVDIVFPDFVAVFQRSDLKDIEMPSLDMPVNPLDLARSKFRRRQRLGIYADIEEAMGGEWGSTPTPSLIPAIDSSIFHSKNHSVHVEGNKITVWMEDLLHTRARTFDDLILVPKAYGEGQIIISTICEEMQEREESRLNLAVRAFEPNIMPAN